MEEPFADGQESKADAVANAVNQLVHELVQRYLGDTARCDDYHLALIGYGDTVGSIFSGSLEQLDIVPIGTIAQRPLRTMLMNSAAVESRVLEVPVWIEPVAKGGTPMSEAIGLARSLLSGWASEHEDSLASTVINISDGAATDGDPTPAAAELRTISTRGGPVLLFNANLPSTPSTPIAFPSDMSQLPDANLRTLFEMSSPLTPSMVGICQQRRLLLARGARGFVGNADAETLSTFLDVATLIGAPADL